MKRVAPTGCSLTQKSSLNFHRLSKVEYVVRHLNLHVNNSKIVVMRLAKPCRRLCILLATHSQFTADLVVDEVQSLSKLPDNSYEVGDLSVYLTYTPSRCKWVTA